MTTDSTNTDELARLRAEHDAAWREWTLAMIGPGEGSRAETEASAKRHRTLRRLNAAIREATAPTSTK